MRKILTCREYSELSIVDNRKETGREISNNQAELLERLIKNGCIPKGSVTIFRKSIKWSHYCGVIQLNDLTVQVLPKIYGKETNDKNSSEALLKMLLEARKLKLHQSAKAQIKNQNNSILDVFIYNFCEDLKLQLIRGKIRKYESKEENLNVIKGRLLVGQQLKLNSIRPEQLYCKFDELHEDILINQIFKFTLRLLYRAACSFQTMKIVEELLFYFNAVTDVSITRDTEFPNLDRTNIRYKSTLEQCKLFIESSFPDVVAGDGIALAILFDMNKLFESWVIAKLAPIVRKNGMELTKQGPSQYFGEWCDGDNTQGRDVFRMVPDISISKSNTTRIVADAKWKILNQSFADNKKGINQSDLYQMQSYANRYGVSSIKMFYPKQENFTDKMKLSVKGMNQVNIEIIPVDINSNSIEIEFSGA